MKLFGILIGLCLFHLSLIAQEMVLIRGNQSLPVQQVDENIWLVSIEGEDFFLLPRSQVDTLTKRIALLNAAVERHERVIAVQDSLLQKYQAFESAADSHIQVQEKMIQTANSLYTGYKSLYTDLKKIIGISTFAFTGGVGVSRFSGNEWRLTGSVGIGYHRWLGQFQFGRDYTGVQVGLHLPLGF